MSNVTLHPVRASRAAPLPNDPSRTGGIIRQGIKIRRFRVVDPKGLVRHGRKLPKGCPFWVKKSSSTVHVDRWLQEGRIKEVA